MSTDDEISKGEDAHCTFAVTGLTAQWQSIYVCRECETEESALKCLCEACADHCHADHDIEYIGMGPSYCDCGAESSCTIAEKSREKAVALGCACGGEDKKRAPSATTTITNEPAPLLEAQTFQISELEDEEACQRLIRQAQTFVSLSRDSHWVDANANKDDLCELERLALCIFEKHTSTSNNTELPGAEWWVQVKDLASENAAVDLHYDKDENLVEAFSLGYFPKLSTVTYLTEQAYPTLVFPHRFDEPEDEQMDSMIVSHPRRGKHLLFDGRLLHGAPASDELRQQQQATGEQPLSGIRVTFLVNVWQNPRPSGINPIDQSVRDAINQSGEAGSSTFEMEKTTIPCLELMSEDDLPESCRDRLELPFVSKGATWVNDDDSSNLILVTFPAPLHDDSDTINVKFGPGMQAYLDYNEEEEEDDDDDGQQSSNTGPHLEGYV